MSAKEQENHNLCMTTHEMYEKIAAVIDSGVTETAASVEKFESYPIEKTTAPSTTYSSAAENQAEDTVYVGQRSTFESPTITTRRVGPRSRCAEDLVDTKQWKPSADW